MTYFSNSSETNGESNSTENFIEALVKEKGEQWKDPNVIAKGYAASQEYIAKLETELRAAGEAKTQEQFMEEVMKKLDERRTPAVREPSSNSNSTNSETDQSNMSVDKIKELVKETLTSTEMERTSAENLRETDRQLSEMFGTEAEATVEKRRAELNMSKEDLAALAQKSPTAFLTLMGKAPQKESNTTVSSTVNTSSLSQNSGKRNFNFYNELRKTDNKTYRSTRIQNQMLQDRIQMGDDFYKG